MWNKQEKYIMSYKGGLPRPWMWHLHIHTHSLKFAAAIMPCHNHGRGVSPIQTIKKGCVPSLVPCQHPVPAFLQTIHQESIYAHI
jgi:hypothetical protein